MGKKEIFFFNFIENEQLRISYVSLLKEHFPFLTAQKDNSEISNDKVLFYLVDDAIFKEDLWLDDSHSAALILVTSVVNQEQMIKFLKKNSRCKFLIIYCEESDYLRKNKLFSFLDRLISRNMLAYYDGIVLSLENLALRNISLHHDINNIITQIDSSVRMISNILKANNAGLNEDINVRLTKYLEMEKKAVKRVLKQMEDLRSDYHEVISGFSKEKVDITEIVKEIVLILKLIDNRNININVVEQDKKILTRINDRLFYFLIFRIIELIISKKEQKKIEINFIKNSTDFKISIESLKKNSILPLDKYLIICFEKLRATYSEIQNQKKNTFSIIFPIF